MDGNGRWAAARGLPRSAGHRRGVDSVRQVVEAAPGLGISTLTLYAFSADNWRRPPREVHALMRLFRTFLHAEARRLADNGVRLSVIGRRDRLAPPIRAAIAAAEHATASGDRLHLRLAIDYSARDAITQAARLALAHAAADRRVNDEPPTIDRARLGEYVARAYGAAAAAPDVDLLIRTGGERRLSDFLLWECAYAELWFSDVMWPDFTGVHLAVAVSEFHSRERRFGALAPIPEARAV